MTGLPLFFVLVGVGTVTSGIMRVILWLDEPRRRRA